MKTLTIIVLAGVLAFSGNANAGNAYLELREEHWVEAMRIGRVDSEILYAISLAESGTTFKGMREYGPWPWVMNIDEKPKFYSSRDAARKVLAEEVEKGNKNIAVGMWQIHLRYNAHYVKDPVDLVDPVTNLYVAAMVLRGCGETYSRVEEVLSCYHSGDVDEAGRNYASNVLKLAEKWGQPFRMNALPSEVRFTRRTQSLPGRQMVVQIERQGKDRAETEVLTVAENVSEQTKKASNGAVGSLMMLASATQPIASASHEEFLRLVKDQSDNVARRVIVVD